MVDALTRPVVLGAIGALVLNDWMLKRRWPGMITGKLSDVAGVLIVPVMVLALAEVVAHALPGRSWRARRVHVLAACAVTGVGFAAVKASAAVARWYSSALGCVHWLVRSAGGFITGDGAPRGRLVVVRADLTDLVALAALLVAYRVAMRVVGDDLNGSPTSDT